VVSNFGESLVEGKGKWLCGGNGKTGYLGGLVSRERNLRISGNGGKSDDVVGNSAGKNVEAGNWTGFNLSGGIALKSELELDAVNGDIVGVDKNFDS